MRSSYWVLVALFLTLLGRAQEAPTAAEPVEYKKLRLAWDEVEDSRAYELEIYQGQTVFLQKTLPNVEWEDRLPVGRYRYRVRAIDQFKRPGAWTAFAEVNIAPTPKKKVVVVAADKRLPRVSYIGVYGTYSSYDYTSTLTGLGAGSVSGAVATGIGGEASYSFLSQWALEFAGGQYSSSIDTKGISYSEFDLGLKYTLSRSSNFYFSPFVSFEYQNTPELSVLTTSGGGLKSALISTMGAGLGVELGAYFTDSIQGGIEARYIYPFRAQGEGVTDLESATLYRYSAHMQYSLLPQWGLGVEVGGDYRDISYKSTNARKIEESAYFLTVFTRFLFNHDD